MAALALSSLPLGFRFHPTDEELVNHYLRSKINNKDSDVEVIPEVDVCKCEPWDLPDKSLIKTDDPEWFFFCPRDRKYPNGSRSNRATEAGYWKATGKDRTIKSRAFGMKSIGTKKTLVFYRGRAPKGERTNWVMHEYRATEKELDGTNDGQSAYVLCRLFRKPDGKTDNSNYDEIEPTGSSPTTTKSSPDGIPSALALVQPTPELDMQVGKQPAGIERWLADRDDHEPEGTSTKVDPQRLFYEPTTEPVDCKVFSPLQSEMCTGLELSFMDSAFANDFGRNHIGLVFQDGTSEQDISISEFFDAGVNNQDEYSCEESTSQKNSAVESEIPTGVGIRQPQYMLSASGWGPVFGKDSGSSSDTDTEVQAQYYPKMEASRCFNEHGDSEDLPTAQGSFGAGATLYVGEYGGGNIGLFQDDSFGLDASSVDFPYRDLFNSLEESTSQTNPVVNAGGLVGTGIKLRAREPQYQSSAHDFATQGTAPRRVRLQEKLSSAEDHEVKPKVIEVEDSAEHTATDERQEETALIYSGIAEEFNKSLRLRSRCEGVVVGDRQGSTISPEMPPVRCHRRPNLSYVYIVSVAVLTIMFMVFIWAWRCLKS